MDLLLLLSLLFLLSEGRFFMVRLNAGFVSTRINSVFYR